MVLRDVFHFSPCHLLCKDILDILFSLPLCFISSLSLDEEEYWVSLENEFEGEIGLPFEQIRANYA
tara:strand:- start:1298 stop:1495 length:198 start_codon:yes stop_codon:yes gene_type:complete